MKRTLTFVAAITLVLVVVALALQQRAGFPYLDWAKKAEAGKPRVAILLEFGHKDIQYRDWSGDAIVTGAKVVHREGYRFRDDDKLVVGAGWEGRSHRVLRGPKNNPVITKLEPVATFGVVMHLEDVKPNAKIAIAIKQGEKAEVALADLLAGKTQPLWKGQATARLITTASPVAVGKTEDDHPAACHGPDGTLWVAYISYTLRDPSRRNEHSPLKMQPNDFKAYCKPGFAEQLFVKSFKAGKWSEPIAITDAKQDLARCAIAATAQGDVWVVYSAHRNANFDLYTRKIGANGKLAGEQRLTKNPGPDLTPAMTTDAQGNLWLAFQTWNAQGEAGIDIYCCSQDMQVKETEHILGINGNCWHPVIAASPRGEMAVAYDRHRNGNYDIEAQIIRRGAKASSVEKIVASTPKFEARPSIVYDAQGRLWIAYEEGPEKWGKDYGSLVSGKGNPLYSARSVRVVCLDTDGKLKKPTAELPTSTVVQPAVAGNALKTNLFERGTRYAYPKIGLDGKGRVWLTYRRNFGSRYSSHPGAYWITFARRLDGQAWSDEVEVHHSDGLLDHRPVLLPHGSGGLAIIHNTDGRYTTPNGVGNQVYMSVIDLPAKATNPKLVPHQPGNNAMTPEVVAEIDSVERMRKHRLKVGGKTLQYLRGEYHRHTEISWDGAPDGSLEDMFRYAIDAARMDWIGNGDHDNGAGREYPWWLTQKFTDAYQTKTFTPMHTYERSVSYPHGHRNVMFAQRGILTLPRLAPPQGAPKQKDGKKKKGWPGGVHPDDTKMLYRYLREFDGICASHTSATGMGTDWRDSDPVVEPIVEIYQGDRMSYEMEGAPRAGYDPQSGVLPANVAGWYPKGFVNLALKKGIKFGFQASSDHWSTHISFFIILAEGRDRQSILKAVKQRHCYGATDNILVDFRCGDKIMGDEVSVNAAPTFDIHVVGTNNFAKIDVLRDSQVIATLKPNGSEYKGRWTEPKAQDGTHYYYIRILQTDGEIAWGSPIWVRNP
ncbi:MAG: hypothetical protein HYX68_12275 [Planctomycetes bacterium]|nr:hypothetical protein [Planctomycetota bacterium]